MAVSIRSTSDGQSIKASAPVPLFVSRVRSVQDRQQYMVSQDGQRFLMLTVSESAGASPITVILNWNPPTH